MTPGLQFQVHWDENESATALGQLTFFAAFLEVTGDFARWKEGCPMSYTNPNAPAVLDVLGTWLLSVLDGQRRKPAPCPAPFRAESAQTMQRWRRACVKRCPPTGFLIPTLPSSCCSKLDKYLSVLAKQGR